MKTMGQLIRHELCIYETTGHDSDKWRQWGGGGGGGRGLEKSDAKSTTCKTRENTLTKVGCHKSKIPGM